MNQIRNNIWVLRHDGSNDLTRMLFDVSGLLTITRKGRDICIEIVIAVNLIC